MELVFALAFFVVLGFVLVVRGNIYRDAAKLVGQRPVVVNVTQSQSGGSRSQHVDGGITETVIGGLPIKPIVGAILLLAIVSLVLVLVSRATEVSAIVVTPVAVATSIPTSIPTVVPTPVPTAVPTAVATQEPEFVPTATSESGREDYRWLGVLAFGLVVIGTSVLFERVSRTTVEIAEPLPHPEFSPLSPLEEFAAQASESLDKVE